MDFREYLGELESQGNLIRITTPISKNYEIPAILKKMEPTPIFFENVKESSFGVVGNLFCEKKSIANYFSIHPSDITSVLIKAIQSPRPYQVVEDAPCQEVILQEPNLDSLPILRHFPGDGGNYITSGVVIARHPRFGINADFHRFMQFSATEMAVRIVSSRHFDIFLQDMKVIDIAIAIGNTPNVLIAAATSVGLGVNELEIANTIQSLQVVRAKTVDVFVPAEAEFVLEGRVVLNRKHAEGPFVDLTETQDIIRNEPVFELKAITHRRDAIWQALLPGALEHKLLMGMPREPTIFQKVNQVVDCLDVNVNPGGCSWLHAIVKIKKRSEDDPKRAIEAAFAGHRSCKHVFVVDDDIDIYDPLSVEWAMATRFQGDRDLVIFDREPGSSLDPSAEPGKKLTTRIGFDLTKPFSTSGKNFEKVKYPEIDLTKFIF
jgi:2,5-furandicarboxylate decarboxylase 1